MAVALDMTLEHALQHWPRWSSVAPEVIRPLHGGLNSESFLLRVADVQLVLRLDAPAALEQRAREILLHELAANAALAPAMRYWHSEELPATNQHGITQTRGFRIVDYIESQSWYWPEALEAVLAVVLAVHQLSPASCPGLMRLDPVAWARSYLAELQAGESARLAWLQQQLPQLEACSEALGQPAELCICHNDLVPANILCALDGRFCLLDWEYACLNHPGFDLATLLVEHGASVEQEQQLLAHYLALGGEHVDSDKLRRARWVYSYLAALWYLLRCEQGRISSEYADQALERYVGELQRA